MSLSRKGTTASRASWRIEIDQRLSWVNSLIVPQLDDPRDLLSPVESFRSSWISDFVIPQPEAPPDSAYVDEGTQTDERRDAGTQTEWHLPLVPEETGQEDEHQQPRHSLGGPDLQKKGKGPESPVAPPQPQYLAGLNLWLVATGLVCALVCGGLDRSIVSVATPAITSEFNSLNDVGWYASAYLLTMCSFQLPFGKLYAELNQKFVFLAAVTIFEVGSIVCAAAPSSVALIVGRAVSGLGAAGIISGSIITIGACVHPSKRPAWLGAMAAVANLAQAFGPLIGGALVSGATWRWCFWINLPLGAITAVLVVVFLRVPPKPPTPGQTRWQRVRQNLDALGTALVVPAVACLLLALQWGGTEYPWGNWRCILLLVLFGVLLVAWVYVQYRRGDRATVPLKLLRLRPISFGSVYTMSSYGSIIIVLYYIPIWFQAVRGYSALQSGLYSIALVLPWTATLLISAQITTRTGYYAPQMLLATILMSTMTGLFTLYKVDAPTAFWVCTLIFFGLGVGLGTQQPVVAAQAALKGPQMALGTSIIMFLQILAGAILVSVAQNVFYSDLPKQLAATAPGVSAQTVIALGADSLPSKLAAMYSPAEVRNILTAYNDSIRSVFIVAVAVSSLSVIGSAGVEWKNIKPRPAQAPAAKKEPADNLEAAPSGVGTSSHPTNPIQPQTYQNHPITPMQPQIYQSHPITPVQPQEYQNHPITPVQPHAYHSRSVSQPESYEMSGSMRTRSTSWLD
ncbi:putative Major facilitator superfamily transporter [Seiridium cardinale]